MAALRIFIKKQITTSNAWIPLLSASRKVLYPSSKYLDPIPSIEQLDLLESEGKLEALRKVPVKPAPTTMTNSLYDDPIYKYYTCLLMKWCDKTQARGLMADVFTRIKHIQFAKYHSAPEEEKSTIELNPMTIFKTAIDNCKPVLSVQPIKKGGIKYQVPIPITNKKSTFMAMKWLIFAGRDKDGPISFVEQMSKEFLDAFHNEGRVVKRKHDLHKLCENNKAYAHYRWSKSK